MKKIFYLLFALPYFLALQGGWTATARPRQHSIISFPVCDSDIALTT